VLGLTLSRSFEDALMSILTRILLKQI